MKQATLIFAMAILLAACSKKEADENRPGNARVTSGQPAANEQGDNTRMNQRDRNSDSVTPMDQANGSEADRNATAQIRREIVSDPKLSMMAKNVKIVTIGGVVTLRGPVKTAEERTEIAEKARQATGVKNVDNQIEITAE